MTTAGGPSSSSLADVIDTILDKGLVIAGDIKINLANVELLTIQIRLLVCSIDKAEQIGLTWWRNDPRFTGRTTDVSIIAEQSAMDARLARIEDQLTRLSKDVAPAKPPRK